MIDEGQLDGRVALITGAARGFGRAIARHLARKGAALAPAAIGRNHPTQMGLPDEAGETDPRRENSNLNTMLLTKPN